MILLQTRPRLRRLCYKSQATLSLAAQFLQSEDERREGATDGRPGGVQRAGEGENLWQVAREPFSVDYFTSKLP
jgi:hypothetical protein